jgi:putative addiction module component (TIGR02574 family)
MVNKVKGLYVQTLSLHEDERQKLIRLLAESVGGHASQVEVERLWNEEAARRYREYKCGKVAAIPADEVFQRLEARFAN